MKVFYKLMVLGVLLTGCATVEWQMANDTCKITFLAKVPVKAKTVQVQEDQITKIPTGKKKCEKVFGKKICFDETVNITQKVWVTKVIDTNKERRDLLIRQCTQKACIKDFGNAECKAS